MDRQAADQTCPRVVFLDPDFWFLGWGLILDVGMRGWGQKADRGVRDSLAASVQRIDALEAGPGGRETRTLTPGVGMTIFDPPRGRI